MVRDDNQAGNRSYAIKRCNRTFLFFSFKCQYEPLRNHGPGPSCFPIVSRLNQNKSFPSSASGLLTETLLLIITDQVLTMDHNRRFSLFCHLVILARFSERFAGTNTL